MIDPLTMHHPGSIYEQRYTLIVKPYGIRVERAGVGQDIDHPALFTNGQNVINQTCALIERRLAGEFKNARHVSRSDIEAAKSAKGGWTKATLAAWGVPWPPPKGWRRALERGEPLGV